MKVFSPVIGGVRLRGIFILRWFNMKTKNLTLRNMVLAALLLALAIVLPFLTGQIPEVGGMLLPMHIPVLLCGFICSWPL